MSEKSREVAALWQRQLDECPEELRPLMRKIHEVKERAADAISERSKIRLAISRHQAWLSQCGDDERATQVRGNLTDLEARMSEADAAVEKERAALEEASSAYEDARLEWRIREVPEARREAARELLREERERLMQLCLATPVDGGTYGGAAGMVFGLEFRLKKAQEAGNETAVADYEAKLLAARARLAELQPRIDAHKQAQQELKDEYERRLLAMIDQE